MRLTGEVDVDQSEYCWRENDEEDRDPGIGYRWCASRNTDNGVAGRLDDEVEEHGQGGDPTTHGTFEDGPASLLCIGRCQVDLLGVHYICELLEDAERCGWKCRRVCHDNFGVQIAPADTAKPGVELVIVPDGSVDKIEDVVDQDACDKERRGKIAVPAVPDQGRDGQEHNEPSKDAQDNRQRVDLGRENFEKVHG